MIYEAGTKVRIVNNIQELHIAGFIITQRMREYAGKTMTIREPARRTGDYYMVEDIADTSCNPKPGWVWNTACFEVVPSCDISSDDLLDILNM